MLLRIEHSTEYRYLEPVFLDPHVVRLTPRQDGAFAMVGHDLCVDPPPAGRSAILDHHGNHAVFLWFTGMTGRLSIRSSATVQTRDFNPYGFLVYPGSGQTLPLVYGGPDEEMLRPYLTAARADGEVAAFADRIARQAGQRTVPFLARLAQAIHEEFAYRHREDGPPQEPVVTLRRIEGACRDFVGLAIAACHHVGLAARFASGYYYSDEPGENRHMHAWLEAYVPGAGWRGFDPTHGIACTERHITVCASSRPEFTLPVTGTFRGFARARMKAEIGMTVLEEIPS